MYREGHHNLCVFSYSKDLTHVSFLGVVSFVFFWISNETKNFLSLNEADSTGLIEASRRLQETDLWKVLSSLLAYDRYSARVLNIACSLPISAHFPHHSPQGLALESLPQETFPNLPRSFLLFNSLTMFLVVFCIFFDILISTASLKAPWRQELNHSIPKGFLNRRHLTST